MSKKYFKGAAASMLLFSVAGITPVAVSAEEGSKDFSMTIFHTNDTHAKLDNVAKFATVLKEKQEAKPYNVLLNAGDVFSGTLYFNEFLGQADLEFMNYFGYDAMVFGNHEFDLGDSDDGHKALADFVKGAKFPIVAANTDLSQDSLFDGLQTREVVENAEDGKVYNGIIKEVNGEKIGIFGLTTEETISIASPDKVTFTNYITEAKAAVAAFEEMGINKIIALTHLGSETDNGFGTDVVLAENVPGIDIIVGGHSHTELKEPKVINKDKEPVLIVQANEYYNFLGELDITFDENGVIKEYNGVLHATKEVKEDPTVLEMLKPYADKIDEIKNNPTGATAEVFLSGLRDMTTNIKTLTGGVRSSESNLGNIITDGMLEKAKLIDPDVVIALQNGGGIRTSINKGSISYGDVLSVLPFTNPLAIIEVTGEELKSTVEHSLKNYPKESGAFLHMAGMKVVFDMNAEPGKRVVSMKIDGKEVEADKMYKAATNNFTAKGGDGFEALEKAYNAGRVSEPGFSDWENFADHLKSLGTVKQGLEGRVVALLPYTDVKMDSWAYPYISDIYTRGILNDSKTFKPGAQITRAEMVSWIVKAHDLKATGKAPFKDLDGLTDELKADIAAAYEHGIIKGTDDKFMPNDKVTRAQFSLIIERALENYTGEKYTAEKAPYTDFGKYSEEAVNAISLLHEFDIATGYEGKFMPEQFTTHQQAAKIISNFLYTTKQVKKAE
ncbi:5'-nucleotidase C-terminal domain-containing protein [Sporosarcina oncorhynchi]|uniref:5'-nucleotidase C-terminal domain-containing protein n=1 Tax=Sporosarcina oncorhynchi TaxID=3056444 RepID=A0ABZ0L845_9BACL|nr:5'-nucleotidase C-terminal domain-containing protein [Sporosarcina sp. T2O-4]WOV88295.1 5'-nucleotidase C-terminal domain-containing protein [Sporosarcina sp. T2O-4]